MVGGIQFEINVDSLNQDGVTHGDYCRRRFYRCDRRHLGSCEHIAFDTSTPPDNLKGLLAYDDRAACLCSPQGNIFDAYIHHAAIVCHGSQPPTLHIENSSFKEFNFV